jgi:hypothetical protein
MDVRVATWMCGWKLMSDWMKERINVIQCIIYKLHKKCIFTMRVGIFTKLGHYFVIGVLRQNGELRNSVLISIC